MLLDDCLCALNCLAKNLPSNNQICGHHPSGASGACQQPPNPLLSSLHIIVDVKRYVKNMMIYRNFYSWETCICTKLMADLNVWTRTRCVLSNSPDGLGAKFFEIFLSCGGTADVLTDIDWTEWSGQNLYEGDRLSSPSSSEVAYGRLYHLLLGWVWLSKDDSPWGL